MYICVYIYIYIYKEIHIYRSISLSLSLSLSVYIYMRTQASRTSILRKVKRTSSNADTCTISTMNGYAKCTYI